ncbi:hypothetical protein JI721_03135 [Alicyclobacillus cycloheptanicus]|nr:hypothetical protein [Alicyclobacillus cycloheptanicus]WDM01855.1 hypothetical protein JI721_03135 [Alicyclobacillus cycloheptanicus]
MQNIPGSLHFTPSFYEYLRFLNTFVTDSGERYLPTSSHAEPVIGLLKGFLNQGNHAHIIVGPYGAGKSLLATLIADIAFSGRDADWFSELQTKFLSIDADIYQYLEQMRYESLKYIPVIMTGSGLPFRQHILSSIYRTLKEYGLDLSMPLVVEEVKQIVTVWENQYRATFNSFLGLLAGKNWSYRTWLSEVENYDANAIEWFKSVYPQLTSGSQLHVSYDHDIVTQVSHVLGELKQHGYGLFLVYDEFGRFLQTLNSNEVHETMQDLQDIAELANHSDSKNLDILLITHRNLGQYALRFNEEFHKEFQRIEKRFSVYYTQADRATFVRLASKVTEEYREGDKFRNQFVKELRQFMLFPELTYTEIESLIINGSFPLHPVSLFVIPQLANLVGQNERTLFTFLESAESGGLKNHVQSTGDWYLVNQIFDYFEPSFSEFEKDSLIGQTYLMFNRLRRKLTESDYLLDELKVLKLITLWKIANLNARQVLSTELISFALLWDIEHTSDILENLQKKKVIRFNSVNEFWDLFEGSGIDIDVEINERLKVSVVDKRQKALLLEAALTERFILPKIYNDVKSMTRFASVHAVFGTELLSGEIQSSSLIESKGSDAAVLFVIDDTQEDYSNLLNALHSVSMNDVQTIYGLPTDKLSYYIEPVLERLWAVKHLMQDKYFLSQDKYLLDELRQLHTELEFDLNRLIRNSFDVRDCTWVHQGKEIRTGRSHLGKYLSEVMMSVFPLTPEIRNESFNRRNITKVQKTAAIKVVDMLINARSDEQLHIDGYGPDYLIYATVVKNNGIELFGDRDLQNPLINELRSRLLDVLRKGKGGFSDFVDIFVSPPFGIRRPVIPVLLTALLKTEWNQIMFYNNLIYTPDVNGELLYYMVENPHIYTFTYQPTDKKFERIINQVETVFNEYTDGIDRALPASVYSTRVLLKWLRQLPKISQSTLKTSSEANDFKEIIRHGEVEPAAALNELYKLLKKHKDEDILTQLKEECERYFEIHRSGIEKQIFLSAQVSDFAELCRWAEAQENKVKLMNPLVRGILDSGEETWVDNLSESIVGVRRENWSDATDNLYIKQIQSYLMQVSNESYKSFMEVRVGDELHTVRDVELSEKSRLIYNNTKTNLKLMSRTVAKEEIQLVLLKLLQEFLSE